MPISITDDCQRPIHASYLSFSGGERHVQLTLPETIPKRLTIRARLYSSDDIFDFLLTRNALMQKFWFLPLDVEIPYLPYARQDRTCAPGQAFSLQVLGPILQPTSGSQRLAVWDCHSPVGLDLAHALQVSASQIALSHAGLNSLMRQPNTVLVCPDQGARTRCELMANALGQTALVYCKKIRDPLSGQIVRTEVDADDLAGRTAIITDDICDGGMTFIKIAEQLKALHVKKIVLFVTHGIFSRGLDVFDGLIDHIYTTDSFVQKSDPRLTCISYAYNFNEGA
jgi:ribose-phosphate pyrophosphokinase